VTENTVLTKQRNNITTKRDINSQSILEFQLLLSHENWKEIFIEDDANTFFNKFLNICFKKITNTMSLVDYPLFSGVVVIHSLHVSSFREAHHQENIFLYSQPLV